MAEYQCPKCHSPSIIIDYPDIFCRACGHTEPLIDYPISWDWHRHYCREYGKADPGSCESEIYPPLERTIEKILVLKSEYQVQINHLEKRLNEHLDFKKKLTIKKLGTTPL